MIRNKTDIDFHNDGGIGGPWYPAINVKVRGDFRQVPLPLDEGFCDGEPIYTHPTFTQDWIEEHVSEQELDDWFWVACEHGWETIKDDVEELFGSGVRVFAAGRSGGWAIVTGLIPVEDWDAIDLNPWRTFDKQVQAYTADIPRATLDLIYYNVFLPQHETMLVSIAGM